MPQGAKSSLNVVIARCLPLSDSGKDDGDQRFEKPKDGSFFALHISRLFVFAVLLKFFPTVIQKTLFACLCILELDIDMKIWVVSTNEAYLIRHNNSDTDQ